ncbi:MAG: putative lipid II flippase FtsW [Rickettsiaceae bacterium]|jgi:cell division protein FtsW|uniref:putative lipid II flippase FtsW n=1 Tax=Candidatus Megaera polyxenophila TaxID=988779 RepID=UPI001B6F6021|nr:putative lipid II flippase FtsW [Rickettsiaceae bacterium]WHA06763.1 putative lipid II flippase FtsW [Candidatus Megaera polyxenophila]
MQTSIKNNFINRWWKVIDQQTIIAMVILLAFSLMLVTTASPAVANRIGLTDNYFSSRHVVFLTLAVIIILTFSLLDKKWIRRLAIFGFLGSLLMLVLVKFYGFEVKGATRWINIGGFSYQPSEFMKPFFAVVTGWILSLHYYEEFPSFKVCFMLFISVAALLIIQPDFGMLVMVSAVFGIQLFVAGLPIIWLFIAIFASVFGSIGAYLLLPHVASRINRFLDPVNSENYQITRSLEAFESGGLYGKGPGEGSVKQFLPDSHTDFIFAVAGEEFGAIICLMIIITFAYIVIRILINLLHEDDKFIQIAAIGIISQFGLQAVINMGVSLNLLPTKGMTLPFISYGGSSTLAISIGMGMLLGLTKRKASLVKYRLQNVEI